MMGDDRTGRPLLVTTRTFVYGVAGLAALTLVGAGTWLWGQQTGTSQAVADARNRAERLAAHIVEADLLDGLLAADATAISVVDRLVDQQGDEVLDVTLWTAEGRAVYARDAAVVGTTTWLETTALEALNGREPVAELRGSAGSGAGLEQLRAHALNFGSHLIGRHHDHPAELPGGGGESLLRVHQPIRPVAGDALLLQTDYDYEALTAEGRRVWRTVAPVTFSVLFLLGSLCLCLSWLSERRSRLLDDVEMPVLTLTPGSPAEAFGTPTSGAAEAFPPGELEPHLAARAVGEPAEGGWLGEVRGGTPWPVGPFTQPVPEAEVALPGALRGGAPSPRQGLTLRTFTGQSAAGTNGRPHCATRAKQRSLEAALSGILLPLARRGVDTRLDLPPGLQLSEDTEELLLRTAEEAVQNSVSYAQAQTVRVRLDLHDHRVELTIDDDGRGFDPAELARRPPNDHAGLRALTRLAADAGGALHVRSAPNRGTRLHLDLPAV